MFFIFLDHAKTCIVPPIPSPANVAETATSVQSIPYSCQDYWIDSEGITHYEDEGAECGHCRY